MGSMIQIRNVPEALHRQLRSRAALAGMSLSDYLLSEIVRSRNGRRSTNCGLACAAAWKRPPSMPPAEAVRAERDRRVMVVEASALLEVLLRTPKAIEDRLFAPHQTLHAPHLLDVEVAQVIRRYAANGEIDRARGRVALTDLADFPLRRYPHDFLLPRIWDLRNNLTACDAAYVALAEALDVPLLTRDQRLAASRWPSCADRIGVSSPGAVLGVEISNRRGQCPVASIAF